MKIWRKRLTYLINELINDEAVCRTAPATPGLLIIVVLFSRLEGYTGRETTAILSANLQIFVSTLNAPF